MDIISHNKSAQKFVKNNNSQSVYPWSTTSSGTMSYVSSQQGFRFNQAWSRDELKDRAFDKSKAYQKNPIIKENTKPQEIKLHTQQRAVKRAMFNYSVATKLYLIEYQKKREEKIQKMIEEEEIRMLRKEMVPRAQLMPFFDRPFFPQRSNRPLTVPKEPCFHMLSSKCKSLNCISCNGLYDFQHCVNL